MANANGWGDGSVNNNIGWGQGANNNISWGKSHLNSWSGETDIDGGNLPSNSVAPAITGTAQEGQTLTCSTGTWSGSPTYTYQWKRNGNNITSETNSTYTLVTADVGQNILCTVTATNFVGSASANSNTVVPTSSVDADAQAFITAASITDPTQQSAINQLVVDLKGYGVWTKMKALYPFVGGTAATHKWNLKDPRDLDAAFRLVFSGGWTHSVNGALPNGTNAYADTFFNQTTNFTSTSNASIGVYLRTNNASTGADMGAGDTGSARQGMLIYSSFGGTYYGCAMGDTFIAPAPTNADSRGFYSVVRNAGVQSLHKRGNITLNVSETEAVGTVTNETIWVGGGTSGGYNYSNRETAFNFIGDALSQSEIDNFYTAVQSFQVTLGRSIGTQTVSDADAQAFVTNAGIVDQVEANAINNLVIGLKADSLWTKMKAVYPFVGGTATTNKYNLVNPLDTDAAFRLVFNGGWTHSATGVLPNGTNAYADTKLVAQGTLGLNSTHVSVYSRTNVDRNAPSIGNVTGGANAEISMWLRSGGSSFLRVNNPTVSSTASTDSRGLFIGNRNSSTQINLSIRGTQTTFNQNSNSLSTNVMQLGGVSPNFFDNKELAFASIGDGLTSQNMTDLTTRITTFQTALNRNV